MNTSKRQKEREREAIASGLFAPGEIKSSPNPCVNMYGPGPEGERCKSCALLITNDSYNRRFFKCSLRGDSRSTASDHRVNWPACRNFAQASA